MRFRRRPRERLHPPHRRGPGTHGRAPCGDDAACVRPLLRSRPGSSAPCGGSRAAVLLLADLMVARVSLTVTCSVCGWTLANDWEHDLVGELCGRAECDGVLSPGVVGLADLNAAAKLGRQRGGGYRRDPEVLRGVDGDVRFYDSLSDLLFAIGLTGHSPELTRAIEAVLTEPPRSMRKGPYGAGAIAVWTAEGKLAITSEMVETYATTGGQGGTAAQWRDRLVKDANRWLRREHRRKVHAAKPTEIPVDPLALQRVHEQKHRELEDRRLRRIAASSGPIVIEERKCSHCNKRPARLDDLCKRCAHAAGLMPRGKIGSA